MTTSRSTGSTPRDGEHRATRYPLTYPDGPHDAETLLVHPRTQRVFVVSKAVFGGTVYAAPRHLRPDQPNRLRAFARVPGLVTDGAFFPDGRHVVLRTYGTASVFTFPAFELVGTVTLPVAAAGRGHLGLAQRPGAGQLRGRERRRCCASTCRSGWTVREGAGHAVRPEAVDAEGVRRRRQADSRPRCR